MAAIDLIVLGMLKKEPMSAYDIQKLVEYRNISKWVKISTPSIYKKVLQLDKKGLIKGSPVREGKMPEKIVYTLTNAGQSEFLKQMLDISDSPINIMLDFNAVIVNIGYLSSIEKEECLNRIERNVSLMKKSLEENLIEKENVASIPEAGYAVLKQQFVLVQAIKKWLDEIKD